MKLTSTILLSLFIPFAFNSCGEKEKSEPVTTNKESILDHVILAKQPAEAIKISELRTNHKAGETVTFSGQIIGSKEVFIDGVAVMIMGDPTKMTTCNLRPGDPCTAPWDVCCDDPDVVQKNIVTVRVLDAAGAPVKAGIKGVSGIKEMSDLTITGMVDKSSNDDNMIVNATGIFVMPPMKQP